MSFLFCILSCIRPITESEFSCAMAPQNSLVDRLDKLHLQQLNPPLRLHALHFRMRRASRHRALKGQSESMPDPSHTCYKSAEWVGNAGGRSRHR